MAHLPVYIQNYNPTIVGVKNFDAHADAKAIRDAMSGVGTNEKAIIKILTTRTNAQIQLIRKAYSELYDGKDLISKLKEEISGAFEEGAVSLLLPRADYDAKVIQEGMKGMGTNEEILIEILCTRTSDQIKEIMKSYDRLYDKELTKVLKDETSGDLEKVLCHILECKRERDSKDTNENLAHSDAEKLYKSGEKKFGTDEKTFIDILTSRSYSHIHNINNEYQKLSGKTLITAIKSELSGAFEKALCTIVEYAADPAAFWARQLAETMKGIGTDDKKLLRIMVTRAEIDLKSVRDIFGDRYGKGKTLLDWVKSDTSGNYENLLVGLLLGNSQE